MLVALVLHYGNGRVLRVYSLPLKMLDGGSGLRKSGLEKWT